MKKIKIIITSAGVGFLPLACLAAGPGDALIGLLDTVASWLFAVLLGVGVIFLILAGFQFIFARGEESKLSTARSMLLWSLIGIAVGALAWFFKDTVLSLLSGLAGPH